MKQDAHLKIHFTLAWIDKISRELRENYIKYENLKTKTDECIKFHEFVCK